MTLALHSTPRPVRYSSPVRTQRRSAAVYARRRAVVAAVCGLIIGGGFFARGAVAENPTPVGGIEMPRTVTAVQGDTLWAIAHRLAPEGNVVALVDQLVKLNGSRIVPGQQILIP